MTDCHWDFHPDHRARENWLLETNKEHESIIDDFLNEYKNSMRFQCRMSLFSSYALVFLGFLGVIGSILALIILFQSIFSQVSFLYFKAINAIQLIYMVFLIEFGLHHFFTSNLAYLQHYPWALIFYYGHGRGLVNILPAWVNVIVLAAAIERVMACHWPNCFKKINKKSIYISAIFLAFLICFSIYLPHVFALDLVYVQNITIKAYGMDEGPLSFYESRLTEWGQSRGAVQYAYFVDSLALLGVVLHLITSGVVIFSFTRIARHRITSNTDSYSKLIDLCLLQLCETIPLAISHIFRVAAQQTALTKDHFIVPRSFYDIPKAREGLNEWKTHIILHTLALLCSAVAHSLSFYFYLAFCPSVRRGFVTWVEKWKICKGNRVRLENGKSDSEGELQTMRANM